VAIGGIVAIATAHDTLLSIANTHPHAPSSGSAPFDLLSVVHRVERAFRATKDGFAATNQGYRVIANTNGSFAVLQRNDVSLELSTTHVGRDGVDDEASLATDASVDRDGVLAVRRGVATESIRLDEEGVEQSWSFDRAPSGDGDLRIVVQTSGLDYVGESASGLHFVDHATGLGVRYGNATWVDARGQRVETRPRFDDGAIEIRVAARDIGNAVYPAVLDPTVSPALERQYGLGAARCANLSIGRRARHDTSRRRPAVAALLGDGRIQWY
jgi:hypothetical protein